MNTPTNPAKPAVLLFRGRGFLSALIRWQSRSRYSHAAILLPDGRIIESWQGAGVRIKMLTDWSDIDAFEIPEMSPGQWGTAINLAKSQVGKKYDYLGVLRFVTRRPSETNERWFCSELVFRVLQLAGVDLFARIDAWAISPGLLSISTKLKPRQ